MNAQDKDPKPASSGANIFEDDDLDAAVGAADATGMVTSQQSIIKTELSEDGTAHDADEN